MSGGGENASDDLAVTKLAVPDEFAGAGVQGAQSGVGPEVAVAAAPSLGLGGDGVVIHAEKAASVDEEKANLRIEAGSHPVGGAVGARRDESAVGRSEEHT